MNLAYNYDQDSHVTGLTWTLGNNQLGNLTYSYDADGRVTAKSGSFAQTNLPQAVSGNTFNADNEMTGFNGTTLSYDLDGNLTRDGTNTYTWDARNHLSAIGGPNTASFVYDAFGRRKAKNINASVTQFVYDGLNPVQELDGANPANVTANMLTGLKIDEYFTRADSNGMMNFLADTLGSTLALTDSTGAINTNYTYEPFGSATVAGSNPNPYQFTGRENDGTGLYFYRARFYSPTSQRFLSQDPIDFAGGINLYAYTLNNPIASRDLFGLCGGANNHSPCSTLAGATGALLVFNAFMLSGAYSGFKLGTLGGTGLGLLVGLPEIGAPLGGAAGTIVGLGVGWYQGYLFLAGACGD